MDERNNRNNPMNDNNREVDYTSIYHPYMLSDGSYEHPYTKKEDANNEENHSYRMNSDFVNADTNAEHDHSANSYEYGENFGDNPDAQQNDCRQATMGDDKTMFTGSFATETNSTPQQEPKKKKERRTRRKKQDRYRAPVAVLVACCMICSIVGGVGGGFLTKYLIGNNTKVLYQNTGNASANNTGATIGTPMSTSDIVSQVSDSVVEIVTETVQNSTRMTQAVSQGAGSGVIITEDGYIVTNNHVIDGASQINVTLKDGTKYNATLVGTDSQTDIALLKIDASGLKPAVMGDSSTLSVGDFALAVGNPLGQLGGTVTDGIISALDRDITIDGQTMKLLQTNAAVNPGNSGGGLFNQKGELIGIVNAKSSGDDVEGLGFAIPINTAKTIIEDLMTNGYVTGRVSLGVTLLNIEDEQTAMRYGVQRTGVYVWQVNDGSDAQKAGIQIGDCILSVNGKEITDSSQVKAILEESEVGDTLTFNVLRGLSQQTITVKLSQVMPQNTTSKDV